MGLRAQILLGLALVTLFAVLSTGYLTLWAGGASLRIQRESAALALATAAAASAAAVIEPEHALGAPENRARIDSMVQELVQKGDLLQVTFFGPDRNVIVSRPPRVVDDLDPPLLLAVLSGIPPAFNYRAYAGGIELVAYAPVTRGTRVLGAARVNIPAPSPVATVLNRSGWLVVGLAIGDALLVLWLGYLVLTKMVVRPLQTVERATARVSAGDWEQQLRPSGPREVVALAAAFNQMTASLASQREQLIRTEKLASVGQLAAGVAHEIGNPLAAILGYVDILRMDAVAPSGAGTMSTTERRDALERVKAETQRIHRIIQDLLEYSRPSRDEAQPTDPMKILKASQGLLEPQARFRGITIHTEVDDVTGGPARPKVMVSAGRLQQVFVNLLINAADAMEGKGTIRVSSTTTANGRVRIAFADSGPGIAADLRRKIFDPFFSTKAPGQGTGLGLAISRSIVETYGGTLEVASDDRPQGATFVITLPSAS